MTALTTEARQALVAAFAPTGLKVYDTVPAVPTPPCIVVVPDTPWLLPERLGSTLNYRARWRVLIVISPRNNAQAVLDIENAVDDCLGYIPTGFNVDLVNPPSLSDTGAQGTVYTVEIAVSAHMKE
jgi:hypothetical protein